MWFNKKKKKKKICSKQTLKFEKGLANSKGKRRFLEKKNLSKSKQKLIVIPIPKLK